MIIKGMIKWVDNEEFFYQRYQQAEDEQDPIKKQLLLNALVADYKYRPEIKHIELLLDSAEKISRAKKRAEYAKADKLKKEFDFLKNLKVSENISGAIITLRNYLEENPETEHKVELKAILNHLVDKLAKQKSRKRLYYSLGGIFLLLFGLSCIQINHCKYTIFSRNKPFEGQED